MEERKFSVNEIKEIFKKIVVNSKRHGSGFYTKLDGTWSSQDVGYFEECMPCFLDDLDFISKNNIDLDKVE